MMNDNYKLTRKDFLKVIGMMGAALSVSSIEIDDVDVNPFLSFADEAGRPKRPWWVRSVEEPTIEIKWELKERFDATNAITGGGGNLEKYIGEDEKKLMFDRAERLEYERMKTEEVGFGFLEQVLGDATGYDTQENRSLLGPDVLSPEDRGMEKWEGTREEAARIVRVAMRQFGAAQIGFVYLDDDTKKLIHSVDRDGKQIVFEDVNRAYETEEKRVIPNSAKWVIAYTTRMSIEGIKHAPSRLSSISTASGYSRARYIQNHTQAFISGLGYQCIGQVVSNGFGASVAFNVLAGHGEMSRLNRMITPEYGPMVQAFFLITDLPVATDKPIDAGIMDFCRVCKKCAEACPSGALSRDDEPSWEPQGGWSNLGHRAYYENGVACISYWKEVGSNCSICFSVCPFSKKDKAWIHSWVKAGVSIVPQLDGFFRSMDDAMSYGAQKSVEEWWYLDLPEFGLDLDERKG